MDTLENIVGRLLLKANSEMIGKKLGPELQEIIDKYAAMIIEEVKKNN